MILVFSEDGGLTIAAGLDDVRRECEGIDVLSDVYRFYDENGNALKPVFDTPVREKRFLWFARIVDSGTYRLEPDLSLQGDPLWVALADATDLRPNERFESLDALKTFLRERGILVDRPA